VLVPNVTAHIVFVFEFAFFYGAKKEMEYFVRDMHNGSNFIKYAALNAKEITPTLKLARKLNQVDKSNLID
jgi:hypothetical protein